MVWFFVIVAALFALIGLLYWRWRKRINEEIRQGAEIEWARFKQQEPEFIEGLPEDIFKEVYARVHTPRFPGYALAAVVTFFATLPITFAGLAGILWGAEKVGMIPEPVEVADRILIDDGELIFFKETPPEAALYYLRDLAGFYYFFGVIAVWLFIVWFFMRRYHARRPGYLRDEIIRAKGES